MVIGNLDGDKYGIFRAFFLQKWQKKMHRAILPPSRVREWGVNYGICWILKNTYTLLYILYIIYSIVIIYSIDVRRNEVGAFLVHFFWHKKNLQG